MTLSRTARIATAAAGSCALGLALALPAGAATDDQAEVSVFHGIPGLTVDVYAGDSQLLSGFEPGTVADPVTLDPGSYDIQIFEAGADPADAQPELEQTVEVKAGDNATVAAHLTEEGDPELTTFTNDTGELSGGDARLTVRHVAAAPAVDVRVDGDPVVAGLVNPEQATAVLPAGTITADVVLEGTDDAAIGPADLELAEGTNTIVYAWGSADQNNLALALQTVQTGKSSN
ncbi:DUF4397 domain-containing protein [Streptomyces aidingensis]|uniref:DUF4397 domain-containing protein n=1 Tax=Streptomyces aidingensis TaxID=910347 RepID=A0A1I1DZH5_9ACTN|nr:DUF4397 domain-containing protein [Streptomyces aidingensis]SFB80207.1 protein of unknown function [Streptomyces aidingensis]